MFKYLLPFTVLLPLNALGEINKCLIDGTMAYTSKSCPKNTLQNFDIVDFTPPENNAHNFSEVPYNSSKWFNDHAGYKKALEISLTKNAPIFIYGRTDWCPYCKKFDITFLTNPEVKKALSKFVKVKLNPEHSPEDKKLFNSWGGRGYPSFFVHPKHQLAPKKIKSPFHLSESDKVKQNDDTKREKR